MENNKVDAKKLINQLEEDLEIALNNYEATRGLVSTHHALFWINITYPDISAWIYHIYQIFNLNREIFKFSETNRPKLSEFLSQLKENKDRVIENVERFFNDDKDFAFNGAGQVDLKALLLDRLSLIHRECYSIKAAKEVLIKEGILK